MTHNNWFFIGTSKCVANLRRELGLGRWSVSVLPFSRGSLLLFTEYKLTPRTTVRKMDDGHRAPFSELPPSLTFCTFFAYSCWCARCCSYTFRERSHYPVPLFGPQPGLFVYTFQFVRVCCVRCVLVYAFRVSRFSLSIAYTLCFIRSRALAFLAAPFIRSSSAQRLHASLAFGVCVLATLHLLPQRCVASWRYTFGAPVVALYWFAAFVRLHVRCPRSALCSCVTRFARSLVCSALVPRARCARYCIRSSACLHSVRVSSAQLSHSELSLLRSRLCVACGACGEPAHCCRGVTGPVCSTGDCVSRVAHVASPRAVVAVSLGRCSSRASASPSAALFLFQLWWKEHLVRVQFPLA